MSRAVGRERLAHLRRGHAEVLEVVAAAAAVAVSTDVALDPPNQLRAHLEAEGRVDALHRRGRVGDQLVVVDVHYLRSGACTRLVRAVERSRPRAGPQGTDRARVEP